jgi:RecB family exonuclease
MTIGRATGVQKDLVQYSHIHHNLKAAAQRKLQRARLKPLGHLDSGLHSAHFQHSSYLQWCFTKDVVKRLEHVTREPARHHDNTVQPAVRLVH